MPTWWRWLSNRVVPDAWRDAVDRDLEDERGGATRGWLWHGWQAMRIGMSLRWATGGSAMWFDMRMAMRSLARARWFTVGAVLTFAVGIGLNLAVFSTVDRVLFQPLPYERSEELVLLRHCSASGPCNSGSFPSNVAYAGQGRLTTLGEIGVVGLASGWSLTPPTGDEPRITLRDGSVNLLRLLGVSPLFGRDASEDDVRAERRVVLLDHDTWTTRFDADRGVLGRQLWQGRSTATIIGVLPPGFYAPGWTSPVGDGLVVSPSGWATIGPAGAITAPVARLKPGASAAAAQTELRALAESLVADEPVAGRRAPSGLRVDPLGSHLFDRWSDYAWLVMAGATLVLVMACANLAGLFLARGRSRQRDAALRSVLGATRTRLVVGTVIEATLVCAAGTGLALLVLLGLTPIIAGQLPPVFQEFAGGDLVDVRVLSVGLGASFLAGIFGGLWPGLQASRRGVAAILQRGGPRGRLPGGRLLLAGQAVLGVCLVVGASATVWSFGRLTSEDLGFDPQDLHVVALASPRGTPGPVLLADYERILEAVSTVPNVVDVAGADSPAGSASMPVRGFTVSDGVSGSRYEVGAGYFARIGGELVVGREFSEAEIAARAPMVVMGAGAAEMLWPGVAPAEVVGRLLELPNETARLVIGVAPELSIRYGDSPRPAIFVPLGSDPAIYTDMLLRMRPGTTPDLSLIRDRIASVAPGWSPQRITAALVNVGVSARDPRFRAIVLTTFAAAALILAIAGLYALSAFEVATLRGEMGIRLALGATAGDLRRLVLGGVLLPVGLGALAGGLVAYWAASFLETFMYQVDARDPRLYVVAVFGLAATAVIAAWVPARRAAATAPAEALRNP